MPLTMTNLEATFDAAIRQNAKYVGLAVTVPGAEGREVIINPDVNFKNKKAYYSNTYHHDLTHKTAPLQIVGFTYGNSFEDIERDLLGLG